MPTEPFREIFKWGPESNWKPYNSNDSRHKYPGSPVFPEPEDGFSKEDNEEFDHLRAVMDWWQGHNYSTADLIGWVSKTLKELREYEILEYWVQYKLPPGMHLGIDPQTLGPGFEELVSRVQTLDAERMEQGAEGAEGQEMRTKRPKWTYRDIEPGESAEQARREGGPLKRPGSAGREGYEKERQRPQ